MLSASSPPPSTIAIAASADMGVWQIAGPELVAGAGMGLLLAPLFDFVLAGVEDDEVGSASGVLNATQQLSGAIGIAAIGTLFFSVLASDGIRPAPRDRAVDRRLSARRHRGARLPAPEARAGGRRPRLTNRRELAADRVQRVDLAAAVPRGVARPALALLDRTAVDAGEAQVAGRQSARARLLVSRVAEPRGHLPRQLRSEACGRGDELGTALPCRARCSCRRSRSRRTSATAR